MYKHISLKIYRYIIIQVCAPMDTGMELMNKFYKGVTLNWACEHLSMGVYKNVSIRAWKSGLISI